MAGLKCQSAITVVFEFGVILSCIICSVAALSWEDDVVDQSVNLGGRVSLMIDSKGSPILGYSDTLHTSLKVATTNNSLWNISALSELGSVGTYSSFSLDSHDQLKISYTNRSTGHLNFAAWNISRWEIWTIDTNASIGFYQDLVIDDAGNPCLGYYDALNKDLKYAVLANDRWEISVVDSLGDVGSYLTLIRDRSGKPEVSYADSSNKFLKYAVLNESVWETSVVDRNYSPGYYSSLAQDNSNIPHIAYFSVIEQKLKLASWNGQFWQYEVLPYTNTGGINYLSLTFDKNNNPFISYYDLTNQDLIILTRSDNVWSSNSVDATGNVGTFSSLAINNQNKIMIGYFDASGPNQLKYAESILPIRADFLANPKSGYTPLEISFNDLSTGEPDSWEWYFGDGYYATEKNPVHIYASPGIYTVYLRAANSHYQDIAAKNRYIIVDSSDPAISANFNLSSHEGVAPLTIVFSDLSSGGPTEWNWSYGDGFFSGDQNPVHTFINPGNYSIVLSVRNGSASDEIEISDCISVTMPENRNCDSISGGSSTPLTSPPPSDLTFSIPSNYLNEHHAIPADITAMGFANSRWNEIPTRFTGSSGNRFYYEADCDQCSLIFIGNTREGLLSAPKITEGISLENDTVANVSGQPGLKGPQDQTNLNRSREIAHSNPLQTASSNESLQFHDGVSPAGSDQPGILWIVVISVISITGLIAGGCLLRRWLLHRQNPALFQNLD